eukprot:6704054-Prymnesium_polylepis.1
MGCGSAFAVVALQRLGRRGGVRLVRARVGVGGIRHEGGVPKQCGKGRARTFALFQCSLRGGRHAKEPRIYILRFVTQFLTLIHSRPRPRAPRGSSHARPRLMRAPSAPSATVHRPHHTTHHVSPMFRSGRAYVL